ncbi:MAG TPA: TonB family protein [Gammaproteobacteria bacterium]|jgi:TonB family protein
MPTHASALAIGHRLQEYIIGRLLGHGGFGLTYLAQDTNLNSLVAIKEFLPQEFAVRNPDSSVVPKSEFDADSYSWGLERFKEEARALARFKHPNIVRVSRLLEAHGTAYMVMDFEPGMTLSQYLKRNGPTLEEGKLLGLFLPVLDGLEALHRLQLVHRDIKPSNIYVRAYGGPMLIDFGAVRQAIGAQSRSLTSLVTPGYAPIEQYSSDGRQGAWSDLYAVGATLYYCMFGHAPADAARRSAAISDGSEDPIATAVSRGSEQYSREILECVDWALQFRVRDRPQSAHEVRERLRTSPVPPQIIEVPESLADVPEMQHGVMSAPTLPASSRSRAPSRSASALEGATVLSAPTERHDSLGPLIDGTRRPEATELLRGPPLKQQVKVWFGGLRQRWDRAMESAASREPPTLTGRIAQQLREPRGVRIALSALVVLALALSIIVFARRSGGGDEGRYQATVAAGSIEAYQAYLKDCHACAHQADAQAALARLQKAAAATALETQFKDLLGKKQLAPPANPNASGVLQLLETSAPDDAYIPQAKDELAAALKAAKPVPAPIAEKKTVEPRPAPKRIAKASKSKTSTKTAATKPVAPAPAPVAAANEVMPKGISTPAPRYPQSGKGRTGYVVLEFQVNVDGSTSDVQVVDSSPPGVFDDVAMHAVHQWQYSPYTLDGVRHTKRIRARIDFKP